MRILGPLLRFWVPLWDFGSPFEILGPLLRFWVPRWDFGSPYVLVNASNPCHWCLAANLRIGIAMGKWFLTYYSATVGRILTIFFADPMKFWFQLNAEKIIPLARLREGAHKNCITGIIFFGWPKNSPIFLSFFVRRSIKPLGKIFRNLKNRCQNLFSSQSYKSLKLCAAKFPHYNPIKRVS